MRGIAPTEAIVRLNQSLAAEEIGVHQKSAETYKNQFGVMRDGERSFEIESMFDKRWRKVV